MAALEVIIEDVSRRTPRSAHMDLLFVAELGDLNPSGRRDILETAVENQSLKSNANVRMGGCS
jgi:hypothetical protein